MAKKQSYKISDSFIKFLIETSNGFISAALLEELFIAIENEAENYHFTSSSEANLIRIISAVFNSISFLRELIQYPHHLEITIAIAASSNYLTDITVRNPEFLYLLFNQYYLDEPITEEILLKEIADINIKFKTFKSHANILRSLKSKSILKIGVRDILGFSSLEETVQQISITATTVLASLFDKSYKSVLLKNKVKTTPRKYCLASLGKLGGRELNYSSDVDLILFFDKNSGISKDKNIEYFELLNETVLLFIRTASGLTANGFLYRIDFRLRPDGKNAPLCRTIADYELYYEIRGEDWERQMLIKLDFLCGSKTLFDLFQSYIVHYVYPVSLSISPVKQIKKMKVNIEKRASQNSNIKLFKGGIRDIEFSVQALQLLNGGKNKELRTGNTLNAIRLLYKYNLLSRDEAKIMKTAYIFYRKIEHFLQLLNSTQTHNIPDDNNIKSMLVKYLSIPSIKLFENILTEHRKKVRKIFDDIVGEKTLDEIQNSLKFEIFKNKQRAKSNFQYLSEGSDLIGRNKFDSKTAELFQSLIPTLQRLLEKSNRPDISLENFTKFMRAVELNSMWYREFSDIKFFEKILIICEYSSFAIELISTQKELSELILSRKVFTKDIESLFVNLNPHALMLILSVQYTLLLLNQTGLSLLLFKYIKYKVTQNSNSLKLRTKYFIIGLGSFGSKSMCFKSDIDLIFVVENLENYEFVQKQFQALLNKIRIELPMFNVDCRLRPEGGKSPLVWDLKSYEEYLTKRARVWEFQSLLKTGFVCGDEKLFDNFMGLISTGISKLSINVVRSEIILMIKTLRRKHNSIFLKTIDIKNGWGSLTYVTFIVSFMLLKNPKLVGKLHNKSLLAKIQYFCRYSKQKEIFIQLKDNFIFLKSVELALQNCLSKRNSVLPKETGDVKMIADFLGIADENIFMQKISQCTKSNNEIYEKVLNEKA